MVEPQLFSPASCAVGFFESRDADLPTQPPGLGMRCGLPTFESAQRAPAVNEGLPRRRRHDGMHDIADAEPRTTGLSVKERKSPAELQ